MIDPKINSTEAFERLAAEPTELKYVLTLYVTGMTSRSTLAIHNLKSICDEFLVGRYELEIIDIYKHPETATGAQIVAVPTLVKWSPLPERRLVGNLENRERVLAGLGLDRESAGHDA